MPEIHSPFIAAKIEYGGALDARSLGFWSGLPLSGPITSRFDMYETFREGQGWGRHRGCDIYAPLGSLIRAVARGMVMFTFGDGPASDEGPLGTFVTIEHFNGLTSGYAHMNARPLVSAGQMVEAGQPIGEVGWTGSVNPKSPAGAHLHHSIMSGSGARYFARDTTMYFDPEYYIGYVAAPPETPIHPPPPFPTLVLPNMLSVQNERHLAAYLAALGEGLVELTPEHDMRGFPFYRAAINPALL